MATTDESGGHKDGTKSTTIATFLLKHGIDAELVELDGEGNPAAVDQRYQVGDEVARGGMGAILRAKDLNLRRDVAMKVVLNPATSNRQQLVRFVHEAQVTGQLEHPSIVPVHELGVDDDDRVFYTMKLVRGTNLEDILKGIRDGDAAICEAYPLNRLLDVFVKACDALAFAHSRGVIHRDLKPENVMVGDYGEVLIVDWGIAKIIGGNVESEPVPASEEGEEGAENAPDWVVESLREGDNSAEFRTMDGAIIGTPAYMAPEQACGKIDQLGPTTDVYASGGILYSILTLAKPIQGTSLTDILLKVAEGNIDPPHEHTGPHSHCPDGEIPLALSAVAMKALSHDQADRYPDMIELRHDVQAYLDGFATSAEEAGFWRLARLYVTRHKAAFVASAAAALILVVVVAAALVVNVEARKTAVAAQGEAEENFEAAAAAQAEAEKNFTALQEEQARAEKDRRRAAPALVRAARVLVEKKDLEGAAVQAQLAQAYAPDLAPGHMLTAQLAVLEEDYAAAAIALDAYLAIAPDDEAATELAALCKQTETMQANELRVAVAKILGKQDAWHFAYHLRLASEEALSLYQARLRAENAWPGSKVGAEATFSEAGELRVAVSHKAPDFNPLKGLPITDLQLSNATCGDLTPLRDLPLRSLNLQKAKVTDLSPLEGLQLVELNLAYTDVADLRPLAGMPIEVLNLSTTKVTDLVPLQGMPLRELSVDHAQIKSLSPLRGAPIQRLHFQATGDGDYSALEGMPLQELSCLYNSLQDFSPLAECRTLKVFNCITTGRVDLSPLRNAPLESIYVFTHTATSELDLAPLRGKPLTKVSFNHGILRSLEPLVESPIETLSIHSRELKDLTPLAQIPTLRNVSVGSPLITDLSALANLQLTHLQLRTESKDVDLAPLAKIQTLESLSLPAHLDARAIVEQLPKLVEVNRMSLDKYLKSQAK